LELRGINNIYKKKYESTLQLGVARYNKAKKFKVPRKWKWRGTKNFRVPRNCKLRGTRNLKK